MDLTRPIPPDPYSLLPEVPSFSLTSRDIQDGELMDIRHSVEGAGISPHLAWSGAPEETKSFAISCFDPDAPTPSGYWHWTILNLSSRLRSVARDYGNIDFPLPKKAVRARNDAGTVAYYGAAPPPGDRPHRYVFAVHALDTVLDLEEGIPCTPAAFNCVFHTIARATITGLYAR